MKYHFVYDEEYLSLRDLQLSSEEYKVVLATVIGNHNAIFYGYKPERLVNAVKKISKSMKFRIEGEFKGFLDVSVDNSVVPLGITERYFDFCNCAENGGVYIKNLDEMCLNLQTELSDKVDNFSRKFQLVATTTQTPKESILEPLLNNFDIVYKCENEGFTNKSLDDMKTDLKSAIIYREGLVSGGFISGRFVDDSRCYPYATVERRYKNYRDENPITALKYLKVSRSLADIERCSGIADEYYKLAESLYNEE